MAQYLFHVQAKNRLEQKGLLKRFSINCYGTNLESLDSIRSTKAEKFKELKNKRGTKEYEEYFLRYTPGEKKDISNNKSKSKSKKTASKPRASSKPTKTLKKKSSAFFF